MDMGVGGFIIGTVVGQLSGAWAYWRVRDRRPGHEIQAAAGAGLVTTVAASAVYILLGVQNWLGGDGSPWGLSVFMGLCMGICQAVLFRGRPSFRRPPEDRRSKDASDG